MSLLIKGVTKLSELGIDVSKDWGAYKIENIGAPDSDDDAARRLFSELAGRWTLAQAHRGADGKIMVFKGAAADPEEEDKPAAGVGGLYGINVETLGADKTLTPGTDKIYQYFDEGGADRIITLATATATVGDRFIIRHNGHWNDINSLEVKQGATSLDKIYVSSIKEFIFDGTNWISRGIGTGENDDKKKNVGIGWEANGGDDGVAIGRESNAFNMGVAVGAGADAHFSGVAIGIVSAGGNEGIAIGEFAAGGDYSIAIGQYANSNLKEYSIALGYMSECERTGETSTNINGDDSDQENNVVQGRWEGSTTDATPLEIFCAGQVNERFTIRPNSVLAFRMTIVARDDIANHGAMWTVDDGLIKRDGLGNTVMVICTVAEVADESTDWAVAVTADDTNESLKIEVTGDPTNPTQFAAVMDGVETHF